MKTLKYYTDSKNNIPYTNWYKTLDKSLRIIVDKRLSKVERGLYGNYRRLSEFLYELKFENGLRIYFTEIDDVILLLLCGGNKSKQSKDIALAEEYIDDYCERRKNGK